MPRLLDSPVYTPYREQYLTRSELRELSRLNHWTPVFHTLLLWAQIFAAWFAAATWTHWALIVVAIPWIGSRYYALYIIGHDGLHRRLFSTIRMNDLWNDVCVLGPIGAITRLNRHNHMQHHRLLGLRTDPDLYKYDEAIRLKKSVFLMGLTGLPYVAKAVHNVFRTRGHINSGPASDSSYRMRDIAIILSWQVALVAGLSIGVSWWAYPVLWLLPVYFFTFTADLFRVFCEHSYPLSNVPAASNNRMITYRSNWLERQFIAPMNMNFHTVHHLWPGIPYYRLATADALLRSRVEPKQLEWRGSYLSYLWTFIRHLPSKK